MENENPQSTSSSINVITFNGSTLGQDVTYQVTKLGKDNLYIWIGSSEGRLEDLSFARETPYDKHEAISTQIFGSISDSTSSSIAAHITKKTKKGVYVSYNLPTTDGLFVREIESRLIEEMLVNPSSF